MKSFIVSLGVVALVSCGPNPSARLADSSPSMPVNNLVPIRTFSPSDLAVLPVYSQFMLVNSNEEQFDRYLTWTGVKVKDLLVAAGVDLSNPEIQSVSVIGPDGYSIDFSLDKVVNPLPQGSFYANLDVAHMGQACGFVEYPERLPAGIADGALIPDVPWMLLGSQRNGAPLPPSTLDPASGQLQGEGPYHLVVPQSQAGKPDRGSVNSPLCGLNDGWAYNSAADHNSHVMVRGAVAIRINPVPAGSDPFDYKKDGWPLIGSKSVVVFGKGVKAQP